MKIIIDVERCAGHGRCYAVAPELFTDDERGYGQVVGDGTVGNAHLEIAHRAVIACPEQAITLDES